VTYESSFADTERAFVEKQIGLVNLKFHCLNEFQCVLDAFHGLLQYIVWAAKTLL